MRDLVLVTLVACGASSHAAPPANTTPPPAAPTVVEPEDFLASLDPATPIEVRVAGDGEESLLGKKRCAYWEWMVRQPDGSGTLAYHSEAPIILIAGDRQVTFDFRDLRTYLAPDFEHTYKKGDADAPAEVAQAFAAADAPPSIYAVEYCLEIGQTYRAVAHDDEYETPGPGGIAEHTHRVLHVGGAPEETPAYRGWSY